MDRKKKDNLNHKEVKHFKTWKNMTQWEIVKGISKETLSIYTSGKEEKNRKKEWPKIIFEEVILKNILIDDTKSESWKSLQSPST